jgi:hypothetical protein
MTMSEQMLERTTTTITTTTTVNRGLPDSPTGAGLPYAERLALSIRRTALLVRAVQRGSDEVCALANELIGDADLDLIITLLQLRQQGSPWSLVQGMQSHNPGKAR